MESGEMPSSPNLTSSMNLSKYSLDRETKNEEYQSIFRLPVSEEVISDHWCSFWRKSQQVGRLWISRNFCCFQTNDVVASKEITIAIPFSEIASIQKERSLGILSNQIKVITLNAREFYFALYNRNEAFETMTDNWRSQVQVNRRQRLPLIHEFSVTGWNTSTKADPPNSLQEKITNLQRELWDKYIKKNGLGIDMLKTRKLRQLVRDGIVPELRGQVWLVTSGAINSISVQPGYYDQLKTKYKGQVSVATEEIDKDIHRTLAHHEFFKTDEGIQKLRNVLTTYSWRNPSIGYCQAMNVVAAAMLLHTNEEASFWMLCNICENLLKDYYNSAMIGSIVDQKIFDALTLQFFPLLHAHLNNIGLPVTILSLPWFMCLFIGYIPWEVAMRIVDCFMYEGSLVLFQVGLALLKLNMDKIMETDDSEKVVELLRRTENYEPQELIEVTFRDFESLSQPRIEEMRNSLKTKTIRKM
eukprot:TRINITY_DN4194_c1_g2_i1.p1 TRINITY_DN4194_c1_g2~~TRINITY_DN4194_c1_g2_i1.p1  ORF type:complete len:479 (-),score=70.92 TRINITY_DN4194_c1_g2_i1:56-1468(-)